MLLTRKSIWVALLLVAAMPLTASAFGVGDVTIKIANATDPDQIVIQLQNTLEMWVANDARLAGITIGIEIDWGAITIVWEDVLTQSTIAPDAPGADGLPDVVAHNRATGPTAGGSCWDLGGLGRSDRSMDGAGLDSLLLGGAAITLGLTAGPSELTYSLNFDVLTGLGTDPDVCVRPIFFGWGGTWTFDDIDSYNPDFNGEPTGSMIDPQGSVCFNVMELDCLLPVFTSTPPATLSHNHCIDYDFQFEADASNDPPADPVVFSGDALPGGAFHAAAPGACLIEQFNVTATNACSSAVAYAFEIVWTNNDPVITDCPASIGKVKVG